ncbi:hypothetical protein AB0M28_09940 [Streptomyces sp. NPDC051940]|uniref:VMAP-C domain-containing protein n=1 Tax=Streptomyces sp. NPDC051940 TaxID=3155675 RepID=UPI003449C029
MSGPGASRSETLSELASHIIRTSTLSRGATLRHAARIFTERYGVWPLQETGSLFHDVHATLDLCDRFPGGLRCFLDALGAEQTKSLPWARVEELYRLLYPDSLLTPDEREQLLALLDARTCTASLAALALRFVSPPLPARAGTAALLDALDDVLMPPDGVHPLLAFVEAAAVREDPLLEDELRTWNDRVARRLGCPRERLLGLRARESARSGRPFEPSRLLVEIDGRTPVGNRFHLRASLVTPGEALPVLLADCHVTSRAALEAKVATVHQQALTRLGELSAGLRVEFVLPRPLLWLEVDQFAIRPSGSVARPIGADHTVLVRSSDRFRNPHWWPALRRRLTWLESHPDGEFDAPAVRCVPPGGIPAPGDLLSELRNSDTPVCFVLLEPPPYEGDLTADPVYVLLEVGIPAIIAVRRSGRHADARPELWNRLGGRLEALPERVRMLRGSVNGTRTLDLHRHITLVWDSRDGLEGAEPVLGHPRTGGGNP